MSFRPFYLACFNFSKSPLLIEEGDMALMENIRSLANRQINKIMIKDDDPGSKI